MGCVVLNIAQAVWRAFGKLVGRHCWALRFGDEGLKVCKVTAFQLCRVWG